MFREVILPLRERLEERASPETKCWWENYVKDSAPFMGVKIADIRAIVHAWHTKYVHGRLGYPEQLCLALALFGGTHTEEKLAGTLFLEEILIPAGVVDCASDSDRFALLFRSRHIYDWNVCDWFCVKVLGPLIQENGLSFARSIFKWRRAENLWQARASLVAFVKVAGNSVYYPGIEASCQVLIRRQERFAKTAVGWILRDISNYDESFVRKVIEKNMKHFSTESLKNATKYFDKNGQHHYRRMLHIR